MNIVVNGVKFRCKERDDKLKTQCSGVSTWGGSENDDDISYYGVLPEVMELDFIFERKMFLFRCKWYNTNPKGKRMSDENNFTSIDITSEWYQDEPFILASQAQQVFYLNDLSRGKNWMIVQKVNHRNIFDVMEREAVETMRDGVFQEENSREMPHFHPTEDVVETSVLVREDIDPLTIPDIVLRVEKSSLNEREVIDIDENSDDGRPFAGEETLLESESDEEFDDSSHDDDNGGFDST